MKKLYRFVVFGIAAFAPGLTGCGTDPHPAYSSGIKYGLRQDPIVLDAPKLGSDRYDPDRPGVLPIMSYDDIFKPENPIFENSAKVNDLIMRDPTKMSAADRRELEKALEDQFGTPAKPTINAKAADIDDDAIQALHLDDKTLEEGSKRYRVHCLHCHGVPGNGRGPTARWINPHPRDFRAGKFKFQSVDQATDSRQRPPSRHDLLRTLRQGIEGTAMPTFALLADDELEALVSYVMHLSIRGQTEVDVTRAFFTFDAKAGGGELKWSRGADAEEPMTKEEAVRFFAKKLVLLPGGWKEANDPAKAIKVEPYPYKDGDMDAFADSVKRGKQLFLGDEKHPRGKNANCKQCHDDYGRQAKFKFDDWATLVRPNNFTLGVFRGGRRPVDLYFRIHSGINGSGMTNFGRSGVLEGRDIWDLINFVQTLPYPAMRDKLALNIN